MQFMEVLDNATDQGKGRSLSLRDPFTGELTGMVMKIVGPDSETARRARLELADDLAELAEPDGRVSADNREKARLGCLAKLVVDWHVEEDDGRAIPFNTRNLRLLLRVQWVEQQVDAFAADRRNFAPHDEILATKADR